MNKNNDQKNATKKAYISPIVAVTHIGLECGFAIESAPLRPTNQLEEITSEWEQDEDVIKPIEW